MTSEWRTVTPQHPCPVCKRPNAQHKSRWCRYTTDGRFAWCPHVKANGSGKDRCVYRVGGSLAGSSPVVPREPERQRVVDWEMLASLFEQAGVKHVDKLAASLGVQPEALTRLRCGLCDKGVWTFPMDDGLRIIGIRTRDDDGTKRSVHGSRNGLFIPRGYPDQSHPRYVCEGPTDTAAMLSLGLDAIGRADCNHIRFTERVCRGRPVVIVADPDEPGRKGAALLRNHLTAHRIQSQVIVPPAKDVRAWINAGATASDVQRLVGDAA